MSVCECDRFVCTRLLSVSDFVAVQKVAEVLEAVGNEFPRLLTSLGRVIVKLGRTELSLDNVPELAEERCLCRKRILCMSTCYQCVEYVSKACVI